MIVFTTRGFDTYALALQTLWGMNDVTWDMMQDWCRHDMCAVFLPYALNDERMRIRRRQWPEAENRDMPWLQIFLSVNVLIGMYVPHAYVPWPDVREQTLVRPRRRTYRWLRRLRLFAAWRALLAGLRGKADLARRVLALVGW
jgi:hypothetical protein